MYLRNTWYAAGWSKDFGRALKPETFLGENIVTYRKERDVPLALEDGCPRRKLPPSKGKLLGDTVERGCHGPIFKCAGACVDAQTQRGKIPGRAAVKSYPLSTAIVSPRYARCKRQAFQAASVAVNR